MEYGLLLTDSCDPSERFQFSGSTLDTDINTTLNMPVFNLEGPGIERQDVVRLLDQEMGKVGGSWKVAAGGEQILAFRSFKIVIVHNWPFSLM